MLPRRRTFSNCARSPCTSSATALWSPVESATSAKSLATVMFFIWKPLKALTVMVAVDDMLPASSAPSAFTMTVLAASASVLYRVSIGAEVFLATTTFPRYSPALMRMYTRPHSVLGMALASAMAWLTLVCVPLPSLATVKSGLKVPTSPMPLVTGSQSSFFS